MNNIVCGHGQLKRQCPLCEKDEQIAALEQRFDALSSKFAALVEENATLRKRLEPKVNHNDFLSQALNEGDGVYRP